jgi:hypothetical protein
MEHRHCTVRLLAGRCAAELGAPQEQAVLQTPLDDYARSTKIRDIN